MSYRSSARAVLMQEEGYRESAYLCTEGYPTIGIGTRIGPQYTPVNLYEFTVSKKVALAMLESHNDSLVAALEKMKFFTMQNDDRKAILLSMAYQLGIKGLLNFKKMIRALENKNYEEAKAQALDSNWYKRQTPERAMRHAEVLLTGDLKTSYSEIL